MSAATPRTPGRLRRVLPHVAIPVVLAIVALGTADQGYLRYLATSAAIAYVLTASYNLVFGYAGIFSLAHAAFYGVGAYASVYAESHWGVTFWGGLLFAMLVTAAIGAAVAWPTSRLRSIFFAIVTLALAATLGEIFAKWTQVTGGSAGIYAIDPPQLGSIRLIGGSFPYLVLCLLAVWAIAELMLRLDRSQLSHKLAALRETPVVLTAVGADARRLRMFAFALSSALAGLAGALYAHFQLTIAPDAFGIGRLVELLLATVIGGTGTFLGPILGVGVMVGLDEAGILLGGAQPYVYGAAIIVLMTIGRRGVAGWIERLVGLQRRRAAHRVERAAARHSESGGAGDIGSVEPEPLADGPSLVVRDVTVRFGGVTAVADVGFELHAGEVLGLIGPNGAGKTSLLNAITGEAPLAAGEVLVDGRPVTGVAGHRIRHARIARTYQIPAIVPDLSLLDNVALGGELTRQAGTVRQLLDSPLARRDTDAHAARAYGLLERMGIAEHAAGIASAQPYGVLRLAEVARCLMLDPRVLLLDEPGAGVTEDELDDISAALRELRESGHSVILIDHHVSFVAGVSDRMIAMDQGRIILDGTPGEVLADPRVIESYMGEEIA